MKKHMYLFLFVGLCLVRGVATHAMFDKQKRRTTLRHPKYRPTSKSIILSSSAIPSTHPPQEKRVFAHPKNKPLLSLIDSCLYNALKSKELDVALHCIEHGANPNMTDDNGNTLLHLSAEQQTIDYIRELYKKGYRINPNITNKDGETVLHILARVPHFKGAGKLAASLLRTDDPARITADLFILCNKKTPLEIAVEQDNRMMEKILLKRILSSYVCNYGIITEFRRTHPKKPSTYYEKIEGFDPADTSGIEKNGPFDSKEEGIYVNFEELDKLMKAAPCAVDKLPKNISDHSSSASSYLSTSPTTPPGQHAHIKGIDSRIQARCKEKEEEEDSEEPCI